MPTWIQTISQKQSFLSATEMKSGRYSHSAISTIYGDRKNTPSRGVRRSYQPISANKKSADPVGSTDLLEPLCVCGARCSPCRRCGCIAHRPRHSLRLRFFCHRQRSGSQPNLNWRPHPYQLSWMPFCLAPLVVNYWIKPLCINDFSDLPIVSCCSLR